MAISATATTHINGQADVVFNSSVVNSKAQLRDINVSVPELNNNWSRTNGYKQTGSTDASLSALNVGASYDAGTKTCSSVACHNGNAAQWGATNVTCNSCHKSLP